MMITVTWSDGYSKSELTLIGTGTMKGSTPGRCPWANRPPKIKKISSTNDGGFGGSDHEHSITMVFLSSSRSPDCTAIISGLATTRTGSLWRMARSPITWADLR